MTSNQIDSFGKQVLEEKPNYLYKWVIPCQRSDKKGQRQKVHFFLLNVKYNRVN